MDDSPITFSSLKQTLLHIKYDELLSQGEFAVVDYLANAPFVVREPVSMYIVHKCLSTKRKHKKVSGTVSRVCNMNSQRF